MDIVLHVQLYTCSGNLFIHVECVPVDHHPLLYILMCYAELILVIMFC